MASSAFGTGIYRIVVADTMANLADAVNAIAAQGYVVVSVAAATTLFGLTFVPAVAVMVQRPIQPR